MQFSTSSVLAFASIALTQGALAANCWSTTGGKNCVSKNALWNYRAEYCGSQAWKNGNTQTYGTAVFNHWGPDMTQQNCWDATQNIIDQCYGRTDTGNYIFNGWTVQVSYCAN